MRVGNVWKLTLNLGQLNVEVMSRGIAWLDTGTHESLLEAAAYIHAVQTRQGLMVACPEEIAWRKGLISNDQLVELAKPILKNNYGKYLMNLIKKDIIK